MIHNVIHLDSVFTIVRSFGSTYLARELKHY